MYQWGRKDPFTFATKSNGINGLGLNSLKIYNAQGKEIVQALDGNTDTNGGITIVKDQASSMLETVKKPNTFYAANTIINQSELTRDIYDYYWTSYSRGTDGNNITLNWNNEYLDGYNQQRTKSVLDPCPYGFRIPVNGTHSRISITSPAWKQYSGISGAEIDITGSSTWFVATGRRSWTAGNFIAYGTETGYRYSTAYSESGCYSFAIMGSLKFFNMLFWTQADGHNIRCIEDAKKAVENFQPLFFVFIVPS